MGIIGKSVRWDTHRIGRGELLEGDTGQVMAVCAYSDEVPDFWLLVASVDGSLMRVLSGHCKVISLPPEPTRDSPLLDSWGDQLAAIPYGDAQDVLDNCIGDLAEWLKGKLIVDREKAETVLKLPMGRDLLHAIQDAFGLHADKTMMPECPGCGEVLDPDEGGYCCEDCVAYYGDACEFVWVAFQAAAPTTEGEES